MAKGILGTKIGMTSYSTTQAKLSLSLSFNANLTSSSKRKPLKQMVTKPFSSAIKINERIL